MIPHKLRLQNFMCYREEQSLDFSGIHLACLAGDNGHGKSALLDAVTWALWGQARARRDDELVTLGETEMWVEFEFGMAGLRYRIWRQRSSQGRGRSDLHFYVWNSAAGIEPLGGLGVRPAKASTPELHSENGEWQLLDEGGLRERQAQIIRVLRMDYETFTNSAFLLQGRADSFTVKTASERKQILADILGLGRYDQYEARAKEEVTACKNQAARLEGELAAIDRDLDRRAEHEARLRSTRVAATEAAQALHAAEAEQARGRLVLQERRAQRRQLEDLRGRLARAERDLKAGRDELKTAADRLAGIEGVLAQRVEIEAGWAALQAAREEERVWGQRLIQHTQISERVARARMAVEQVRLGLESDRRRLSERHEESGRKVAAGVKQAEVLAEVQHVLAELAVQQTRRAALAAEVREVAEWAAALQADNQRLKAAGQLIDEKVALLSEAADARCPLCGQPLGEDHRDRVIADLNAEKDGLAERWHANQVELKTLAGRKAALEAEDAELVRVLRVWDARQRQAAQAESVVAEGEAAAEEQARLFGQIAYQRQLLPALDGVDEARGRVGTLVAQVARRAAELVDDQAEAARLTTLLADLPQLEAVLAQADAQVERAAQAERRARQEEGAAMQRLDALAALAAQRVQRLAELDQVNAELGIYNELREAFGKRGLQAMIIESAIPEVEVEANQLLNRMTEGRMSLRLETQREKVTGGVAETLDILISDELGARAYEMYSGGESFRANLALRIAISKLLARRAGAQLQTLVIDEGFGSQDTQGRALLVEAINSIQHDFERIIVITHIEELKDLFPARIDVVKTASGSRVSIV
ncbi:MAG: hypothetical protein CVU38_20070 [Chloroflexi bacterium HGW-Chloroflexi-1]|nr:MAG: hypothetical protein CVU38_20070 [Chloroflexi bacterium HGW-Chloroflexi-1]